MATIYFEKYKDAGSGNYTELITKDQFEMANALINILTNRRKGYPREVASISGSGDDVVITINTMTTTKKIRTINNDPTLE